MPLHVPFWCYPYQVHEPTKILVAVPSAKDVCDFVAACSFLIQTKTTKKNPTDLLQPLSTPRKPWSHISLDFVTGLPSSAGDATILPIVDWFSKMMLLSPCPSCPQLKKEPQFLLFLLQLRNTTALLEI